MGRPFRGEQDRIHPELRAHPTLVHSGTLQLNPGSHQTRAAHTEPEITGHPQARKTPPQHQAGKRSHLESRWLVWVSGHHS